MRPLGNQGPRRMFATRDREAAVTKLGLQGRSGFLFL